MKRSPRLSHRASNTQQEFRLGRRISQRESITTICPVLLFPFRVGEKIPVNGLSLMMELRKWKEGYVFGPAYIYGAEREGLSLHRFDPVIRVGRVGSEGRDVLRPEQPLPGGA